MTPWPPVTIHRKLVVVTDPNLRLCGGGMSPTERLITCKLGPQHCFLKPQYLSCRLTVDVLGRWDAAVVLRAAVAVRVRVFARQRVLPAAHGHVPLRDTQVIKEPSVLVTLSRPYVSGVAQLKLVKNGRTCPGSIRVQRQRINKNAHSGMANRQTDSEGTWCASAA